jgi:hypothetical protein
MLYNRRKREALVTLAGGHMWRTTLGFPRSAFSALLAFPIDAQQSQQSPLEPPAFCTYRRYRIQTASRSLIGRWCTFNLP